MKQALRQNEQTRGSRTTMAIMLGIGGAIGLWAALTMGFALAQTNWQVGEVFLQYMMAIGMLKEHATLVDFYTYIKGIEYIIIVSFLVLFPVFFRYLNHAKETARG
jgi:hypothetical protein